jgi:hypothetical protein
MNPNVCDVVAGVLDTFLHNATDAFGRRFATVGLVISIHLDLHIGFHRVRGIRDSHSAPCNYDACSIYS